MCIDALVWLFCFQEAIDMDADAVGFNSGHIADPEHSAGDEGRSRR